MSLPNGLLTAGRGRFNLEPLDGMGTGALNLAESRAYQLCRKSGSSLGPIYIVSLGLMVVPRVSNRRAIVRQALSQNLVSVFISLNIYF